MQKEPSPAKRCENSGKDAKRAVLWKKNRLCYIELDFDRINVIKNKFRGVTNIYDFFVRNTFETEEKVVEKMRKEPTFM